MFPASVHFTDAQRWLERELPLIPPSSRKLPITFTDHGSSRKTVGESVLVSCANAHRDCPCSSFRRAVASRSCSQRHLWSPQLKQGTGREGPWSPSAMDLHVSPDFSAAATGSTPPVKPRLSSSWQMGRRIASHASGPRLRMRTIPRPPRAGGLMNLDTPRILVSSRSTHARGYPRARSHCQLPSLFDREANQDVKSTRWLLREKRIRQFPGAMPPSPSRHPSTNSPGCVACPTAHRARGHPDSYPCSLERSLQAISMSLAAR
jgi:hypothetical protein